MDRPVVSVVMSVYNGLPHVAEAVESILGQTFRDFEFIIIDDGSTDGSREVLRAFAQQDPRIQLIEQANTGLTKALIRGVDAARGELIARMDADDASYPERLALQVEALAADKAAVAVTCDIAKQDPAGEVIIAGPRGGPALFPWFNIFYNAIAGHGQLMFRKDAYRKAGGYDPAFRFAQDYDLWRRMMDLGLFLHLPRALYMYRVGDAESITRKSAAAQFELSLQVTRTAFEALTGKMLSARDAHAARRFWMTAKGFSWGDVGRADRAMRQAFDAYFTTHPERLPSRPELAALIADRWAHWARRCGASQPLLIAILTFKVARWSPQRGLRAPFDVAGAQLGKLGRRFGGLAQVKVP